MGKIKKINFSSIFYNNVVDERRQELHDTLIETAVFIDYASDNILQLPEFSISNHKHLYVFYCTNIDAAMEGNIDCDVVTKLYQLDQLIKTLVKDLYVMMSDEYNKKSAINDFRETNLLIYTQN